RSLTEAAKEVSTGSTTGGFSSSLPVVLPPQAVSMETAMMPASIREAIFLSFIVIFSSLWCIKDRDPKQAERKVLSFQRHYSIPPRCQGPIYYFFVFAFFSLSRAGGARVCFHFYASFYAYLFFPFLLCAKRKAPVFTDALSRLFIQFLRLY